MYILVCAKQYVEYYSGCSKTSGYIEILVPRYNLHICVILQAIVKRVADFSFLSYSRACFSVFFPFSLSMFLP